MVRPLEKLLPLAMLIRPHRLLAAVFDSWPIVFLVYTVEKPESLNPNLTLLGPVPAPALGNYRRRAGRLRGGQ